MKVVNLGKSEDPVKEILDSILESLQTVVRKKGSNSTFKAIALDDATREPREIFFTISDNDPHDW